MDLSHKSEGSNYLFYLTEVNLEVSQVRSDW